MFDMKRACVNCPFRKGQGELFKLRPKRLKEIFDATAFQCHKTLEGKPQQCVGVMSLLIRERKPNQIMQVAFRFGALKSTDIEHDGIYDSIEQAKAAHGG